MAKLKPLPTAAATESPVAPLTAIQNAAPRADKFLWDDSDAAEFLCVEPRTLRLWRRTRGLPFIRISSKSIRYRRCDVEGWLERRRVSMKGTP